jgi:hypothetical protein
MTDIDYMNRYDDETWRRVMDMKSFPSVFAAIKESDFNRADRLVADALRRYTAEFPNETK